MGRSPGVTNSVVVALALVVTIALSFAAYIIGQRGLSAQQAAISSQAENIRTAQMERLGLVYWDFAGRAWIQNTGDTPVTIVRVYVNDQEVWQSSGKQPVTIQPQATARLDLPYRGHVLAVETYTGNIHVLRR
jgi:hypothetical protein